MPLPRSKRLSYILHNPIPSSSLPLALYIVSCRHTTLAFPGTCHPGSREACVQHRETATTDLEPVCVDPAVYYPSMPW